MRPLGAVALLLAVAVPASGQDNDAEKLYRAMEKKLRAVKTLQFDFEADLEFSGKARSLRGQAAVGAGDKAKIEYRATLPEGVAEALQVCDGTQLVTEESGKAEIDTKPVAKEFNNRLLTGMARGGVFFGLVGATKEQGALDDLAPVCDFKLGAREKVGGRDTQAVEFTLAPKGGRKAAATVWIDTQTNLPAKVGYKINDMAVSVSVVETYANMVVDGKIDARAFDLPGAAPGDLKPLQGKWVLARMIEDGKEQKLNEQDLKENPWLCRGDKLIYKPGTTSDNVYERLRLDATKDPHTMDVHEFRPTRKGRTLLAIYRLDGDTLLICLRVKGAGRPTEFESRAGTGDLLLTLRRAKD